MEPLMIGAIGLGAGAMLGMLATTLASSDPRIARIERKLNTVLEQLGVDQSSGLTDQLRKLLADGQKIEAVKLYRDHTGCDLRTAKEYVESL